MIQCRLIYQITCLSEIQQFSVKEDQFLQKVILIYKILQLKVLNLNKI
jgi:hypothetical protein